MGAVEVAGETANRLALLKKAIDDIADDEAADAAPAWGRRVRDLETRLADLGIRLRGDRVRSAHSEPRAPAIVDRVRRIVGGHWKSTSAPTQTSRRAYDVAATEFEKVLQELRALVEEDLAALEEELENAEAPWTPGRVPRWQRQ